MPLKMAMILSDMVDQEIAQCECADGSIDEEFQPPLRAVLARLTGIVDRLEEVLGKSNQQTPLDMKDKSQ